MEPIPQENVERRVEMTTMLSLEKKTQIVISVFGVLVTVIAIGVWDRLVSIETGLEHRLEGMEATLAFIVQESSAFTEYKESHKHESNFWVRKIGQNAEYIYELRTDAGAREDPYTGTEAEALERRIDAVEMCCSMCTRDIDLLETN